MPRRRRDELVVIFWRDIPTQVNVFSGDERLQFLLEPRFQQAVMRAKRKAKIHTYEADIAQWRREAETLVGDATAAGQSKKKQLESALSDDALRNYIYNAGWNPASDSSSQA